MVDNKLQNTLIQIDSSSSVNGCKTSRLLLISPELQQSLGEHPLPATLQGEDLFQAVVERGNQFKEPGAVLHDGKKPDGTIIPAVQVVNQTGNKVSEEHYHNGLLNNPAPETPACVQYFSNGDVKAKRFYENGINKDSPRGEAAVQGFGHVKDDKGHFTILNYEEHKNRKGETEDPWPGRPALMSWNSHTGLIEEVEHYKGGNLEGSRTIYTAHKTSDGSDEARKSREECYRDGKLSGDPAVTDFGYDENGRQVIVHAESYYYGRKEGDASPLQLADLQKALDAANAPKQSGQDIVSKNKPSNLTPAP